MARKSHHRLYVQTYKDFEIIIADDGSREATKNLIDKLEQKLISQ
jgi:glycosyltransferase involved in cell wall biosynthesis